MSSHYPGLRQATALRPDRLIAPAGDSHLAVSADWLLLLCLWRGRQRSVDDPYKNYESGLLHWRPYFMIVAILLTFVHECKPDSRQPLAEVGISHGHLCCSRPSSRNKDAFGRTGSGRPTLSVAQPTFEALQTLLWQWWMSLPRRPRDFNSYGNTSKLINRSSTFLNNCCKNC